MAKAMGPFKDSHAPSWLFEPQTDVLTEPSSHWPCLECYVSMRPYG